MRLLFDCYGWVGSLVGLLRGGGLWVECVYSLVVVLISSLWVWVLRLSCLVLCCGLVVWVVIGFVFDVCISALNGTLGLSIVFY